MKETLIIFIIGIGFSCIQSFVILPSINRIVGYHNNKQQLHLNHVYKNNHNHHHDLKMIYKRSSSSRSSSIKKTIDKNKNQPAIDKIKTSLFATPINIEIPILKTNKNNEDADIDNINTIDRDDFIQYYRQIVTDNNNNQEMTKEQFINYKIINQLLIDKLIYIDDVNDLWISVVGDSIGVNEDEGYELICMIKDLPDPEILEFYNQEYLKICKDKKNYNNDGITFFDVLNWSEMKTLISDDMITMEEISNLWKLINNDNLNSKINKLQFNQLNRFIDDLLEKKEDNTDASDDASVTITSTSTPTAAATIDVNTNLVSNSNDNDIIITTEIDVWSSSFDPKTVFDIESLEEITNYYITTVGGIIDNEITYESIIQWNDIIDMIQEGSLTIDALNTAWKEAINTKLSSPSSSTISTTTTTTSSINYDQFLRLNVRLDLLMDEIEAKNEENKKTSSLSSSSLSIDTSNGEKVDGNSDSNNSSDNNNDNENKMDAESFYRSEFNKITSGGSLMRLDMLLSWKEISDLIADGSVSQKQITRLFDSMPKEPMGLPSTIFGITETTFINFNNMLDVLLDVTSDDDDDDNNKRSSSSSNSKVGVVPSVLVSEPSRPMPKNDRELKMGSMIDVINSNNNVKGDESTTGLSVKELEMMEFLDKADNMLNSGSFGDFDQLIGDLNDPRLQALRLKRDGADEVKGQLNDILKELLQLGRLVVVVVVDIVVVVVVVVDIVVLVVVVVDVIAVVEVMSIIFIIIIIVTIIIIFIIAIIVILIFMTHHHNHH